MATVNAASVGAHHVSGYFKTPGVNFVTDRIGDDRLNTVKKIIRGIFLPTCSAPTFDDG